MDSLYGRYVQDGAMVQILGNQTSNGTSLTFAEPKVSVSVRSGINLANILVKGRQTAVIDIQKKLITYTSTGEFESLFWGRDMAVASWT